MENPDEVEGVVEGEKENILLFFKDLKTGHSMAVINKVEISDFYEDVGKEFTIRR
jgi:hydrogenase maturation factor HypF (carbamoyltransferase family)